MIRGWCPGVLMRLRLKGALRLMSVENLSTGMEASATGESLNSGDPALHPAARHRIQQTVVRIRGGSSLFFLILIIPIEKTVTTPIVYTDWWYVDVA